MNVIKKSLMCVGILVCAISISCKKEKKPLTIPSTYESTNYDSNVTDEKGLITQLKNLSSYMKTGNNVSVKLNVDTLKALFADKGTPSLKSATIPSFSTSIENDWFPTIVNCSQNAYDVANGATATNGGVYGGRLLDKRGLETLQYVEKGLFTTALYNQLTTLTKGAMTEATVDKMICVFGAHPTFPNTTNAANTSNPDLFIASYTARRDKNDGTGFYTQLKQQFITLKAAIAAGEAYNEEKNAAISKIKLLIEKAIMATVINYSYAAIPKFTSATPTVADNAGGIHDISECAGFVLGFKSIPQTDRKISDSEIDAILGFLNAPAGAESTMYKFVSDPVTESAKITSAIAKIKSIYQFTDSEMIDFKTNWVAAQNR